MKKCFIQFIIIIFFTLAASKAKGTSLILGYGNPDQIMILDNQIVQYDTVILLNNSSLSITNSTVIINKRLATFGTSNLKIENSIFTVNGSSFFVENCNVNIKDSVSFNGHIYLQNSARLNVDSGFFYMDMDYYYQYYLFSEDSSEINFSNTTIAFKKGKLGGTFSGNSHSILTNLNFLSPVTFIYCNSATALMNNCRNPVEFIFHDSCNVDIVNSKGYILWFGIDSGGTANFSFPAPNCSNGATNISSYTFSAGSTAGISGVYYTINITNTDTVFFCTMQEEGSDVTINNPFIYGCGFNFYASKHYVSGIFNDTVYSALSADFDGVKIYLNNSRVFTWNFYPLNNSELFIENSIFGEMVSYDSSTAVLTNSVCDGNGTKLGAYNHSRIFAYNSKFIRGLYLYSHPIFITKNYAFSVFYNCEITGDFIINDYAKLYLSNSVHNKSPTVNNSAYMLDVFLDSISTGFTDSPLLITGTINHFKAPQNTDNISGYEIGYSLTDSTNYLTLHNTLISSPVINDTLFLWNTASVTAGNYILWLTVYVNGDSAISAGRNFLMSDGANTSNMVDNFFPAIVYPNPATNRIFVETSFEHNGGNISVFKAMGKLIAEKPIQQGISEINISDFAKGMYFIKVTTDKKIITRKFIKE